MRLRMMNPYDRYADPSSRSATWTAGFVGGAIGMIVMGAIWYVQTRGKTRTRTPQQIGWSHQGQAPSRSHIQSAAHVANQYHAEPR